ncbi:MULTISPECIES: HlyD family efflux transporter periplasmic adaptor subunit [Nostoc]|uniref:HlyD family efflux transporter periplasmic adaptor subunit n=1 Tax=Nostoc paludosum FACHB-159 TaxID=2692908 RepID=A0ABR8K3P5_9NOSO|nr:MULTISPECIES: HlyD family efflux transporter periplasmic adaptor subunit [Nostoc]MBD2678286.1 HlyD family efflux transporter periplasmic adaptor subunit [Nostoc sp. FACHB-857]MBD2733404.1 HlyD family efflux transporter periplasmic adaptor subunit [Nostoc paludosum FACHB-159]
MSLSRPEENYFGNRFNQPLPEQLNLVEANEFLPPIGKWTTIGAGVLLGTFLVGVTLTSVLNYNVTVKVPASIRPVGELRVVQSAMTGSVQNINVQENQVVTQGQAIATIDDSRLQTQKSQLESSIRQSKLQLTQIDAQLHEIEIQIAAQTSLNNRSIIAAQAQLDGTQRNYEDRRVVATAEMAQAQAILTLAKAQQERSQQQKLFRATLEEAEAALTLAKVQRDRLQREKVLTATVQEAEAALTLARVQRDRLQPIVASGAVPQNLFEEKEQAIISAEAKLEEAKTNAKNLQEEKEQAVKAAQAKLEQVKDSGKNILEEKEQALRVAETNLKKAKTAINPTTSPVTVASERIKQEQARGEATLAGLKKERETLLQQHLELQKEIDRTTKELQQIKTDLDRSIVRSPITGTLLQLNLRNPGQVVQPSEAIAQIAPLNAPLLIKARVPAQDIDKVKPGQQVKMQVSACPYPDYGTLNGSVKTIAPDALPIVKNNANPSLAQVVAYEVTIEPQTPYVGSDRQCYLKSGMEGRSDIISRQETVLKFILRKARFITEF